MVSKPFGILREHLTPRIGSLIPIYFVPNMENANRAIELLAEKARLFEPEVTIGILDGGYYPAQRVSRILRTGLDYMRISHYRNQLSFLNEIPGSHFIVRSYGRRLAPIVQKESSLDLYGKRVLIIDDNSFSMKTLDTARTMLSQKKPREIKTAVVHTSGKRQPDYWIFNYSGPTLLPWRDSSPYYEEYRKTISRDPEATKI